MDDLWISDLKFALQGQKHGRWETISNGVSGMGEKGMPRQAWLESSWFSDEGQYQLELTRISLLPKESLEVTYDYSGGADRSAGYCFMDKQQLGLGMIFLPRYSRKHPTV